MGSEEGLQAKRSLENHIVLLGGELMDTLWNVEVRACQSESDPLPGFRATANDHLWIWFIDPRRQLVCWSCFCWSGHVQDETEKKEGSGK